MPCRCRFDCRTRAVCQLAFGAGLTRAVSRQSMNFPSRGAKSIGGNALPDRGIHPIWGHRVFITRRLKQTAPDAADEHRPDPTASSGKPGSPTGKDVTHESILFARLHPSPTRARVAYFGWQASIVVTSRAKNSGAANRQTATRVGYAASPVLHRGLGFVYLRPGPGAHCRAGPENRTNHLEIR